MTYSHEKISSRIDEHAIGSQLPRANGSIQLSPDMGFLRPLLVADGPTKTEDLYYGDFSSLYLRIVSFADATLVILKWPHCLFDTMSMSAIVKAWSAILEGREQDVPNLAGEDRNPLATLGARIDLDDEHEETYLLQKNWSMTNAKLFKFVFNLTWETTLYRAEEERMLLIPPSLFAKIRAEAFRDLEKVDQSTLVMDSRNPSKPFLSDNDIMCAWMHRLFTSCQPWALSAPPTRIIHIMNMFNMNDLLRSTEPKLIPKDSAFIGNAVTNISSMFQLDELLALPLGVVAARIRSDLAAQSTRSQINASMRTYKAAYAATGQPPLFGDGDMVLASFTNWEKAKFWDTDFGAAVVQDERGGKMKHTVGKPAGLYTSASVQVMSIRNSCACAGKDKNGNFWFSGILRPETWANVQRKLEEIERGLYI